MTIVYYLKIIYKLDNYVFRTKVTIDTFTISHHSVVSLMDRETFFVDKDLGFDLDDLVLKVPTRIFLSI